MNIHTEGSSLAEQCKDPSKHYYLYEVKRSVMNEAIKKMLMMSYENLIS